MPPQIVLASASPRRKMLLEGCALGVVVRPADVDEAPLPGEAPRDLVLRLARKKAHAVDGAVDGAVVVAADTTVVLDGASLAKPDDDDDARSMLRRLSGRTHEVLTGWCVRGRERERTGVVRTEVSFRALSDDEIEAYVKTGEPRDKAGAYGIQGHGGALVDHVQGSYTNVVGLPLAEVLAAVRELL